MGRRGRGSLAVIFDIDGTLVDTNYQHSLAWYRAFREEGIAVPIWQIHRAIGIGSDRVVELPAGREVEAKLGDALRDAQGRRRAGRDDRRQHLGLQSRDPRRACEHGVLTGGFSELELSEAGATVVFDSVEHLHAHLSTTTLEETVSG